MLLLAVGCAFVNLYILLPVAPVLAEDTTRRGGAGLANSAFLGAAVLTQMMSPVLLNRYRSGRLLAAALLSQGFASLLYVIPSVSLDEQLVAAALRGAGFGIATVVSGAMVVSLTSRANLGSYLGAYGLVATIPSIFVPSVGLALQQSRLLAVDAIVAATAGVVGAAAALAIVQGSSDSGSRKVPSRLGVWERGLLALLAASVITSIAFGATFTFLPVVLPHGGLGSAVSFLLVSAVFRAAGRWVAGRWIDRFTARQLLNFAVLLTVAGLALIALRSQSVIAIIGSATFGFGLGIVQTAVYLAMVARAFTTPIATISALWNTSIDFGAVVGTSVLGALGAGFGYVPVLWAMPLLTLFAFPAIWLARPMSPDPAGTLIQR